MSTWDQESSVTDHKPLTWLFSVTNPGLRLIRWRLKLKECEYEINHQAGKSDANADALIRSLIADEAQINNIDQEKEKRDYSKAEK